MKHPPQGERIIVLLGKCITTLTKSHVYAPARGQKGAGVIKERKPKVTIRGEYYGNRTLPSLNDYIAEIGKNPKAGGQFKASYTKPIINAIRRCLKGWKVSNPPVILHYKFFERKKGKRRDVMNIFTLADKFFEDALQQTGTIENDNPDWVENTTHEFAWIEDEPYIEIEIEERGKNGVSG